ncbi:MAG: 2-hydroxyacid dehydrogenase [Alphaproteobacteria bacterium]|nr:2-hydroxyacid dehydrogenase [Alphaproteobacteria bacterium]
MSKTLLALGAMLPDEMTALDRHFAVIRLWKEPDPEAVLQKHRNEIVAILSRYDGKGVSARMIEALPNLEIIAQYGVGVNNIDLPAAGARGVVVTNTPDVVTDDTANTALALMLAVSRRVCEADMFVRCGKWRGGATFPLGTGLAGKTVGILGLGRIGQAIARRCAAFDMNVVYHGPREKPDQPYAFYHDLHAMAEASDFLVLSCVGGPGTEKIVDYSVLEALGPRGFLINVARGSVVREQDLLAALYNKAIAGAGLDVYENEPNVPESLFSMDHVVLLPHIGGHTHETKTAMGRLVMENLLAHFNGEPVKTRVAVS